MSSFFKKGGWTNSGNYECREKNETNSTNLSPRVRKKDYKDK